VPTQTRRDDADVNVVDRREFTLERGLALASDRLTKRAAVGVDAERVDQSIEQRRHCVVQDLLLVRHRPRVIDHEQEVDLVDRDRVAHATRAARAARVGAAASGSRAGATHAPVRTPGALDFGVPAASNRARDQASPSAECDHSGYS